MSHTDEDALAELSILDRILAQSNITLGYVLQKQDTDGVFDTTPLVDALARVTDKWRLLAGRVVWDTKTKTFGVHVPTRELKKPGFKFTTATYNKFINPQNLTETGITSRPDLKYFAGSSIPSDLAHYASSGHPILSLHVSHLSDTTCVGITYPHGIFDATGIGFVLKALDAELTGGEWIPPPLESHNLIAATFTEMLNSPEMLEAPTPAAESYKNTYKPFSPGTIVKYLGSLTYEHMFHNIVTKNIFLDKATVNRMVHEVKEQVKTYGSEKWVSTGDVILAWFIKAALGNEKDFQAISVATSVSFRTLLASTEPGFTTFPHNCMANCPMPQFSSSWLRSATIAEVALKHREHVEQVRTLSFVQSAARHFASLKDKMVIPARRLREPDFLLSNQVVAGLTDINFGTGAQVEGFWEWCIPVHPDHMGFINRFNEGYVIMAKMRNSRWHCVEKEIEQIKGGGSFS